MVLMSLYRDLNRFGSALSDRFIRAQKHSLGSRYGDTWLNWIAHFGHDHFESGQAGDHIKFVGVTHVADSDNLALELILTAHGVDPELLLELVADR